MISSSYDLLHLGPIRALIRWGGLPHVFQALMLVAFAALAGLSWGDLPPAGVPDKLHSKTHLVQLLIWGLWWPAMVWAAVLLGRGRVVAGAGGSRWPGAGALSPAAAERPAGAPRG
jgi:hypothetical protein